RGTRAGDHSAAHEDAKAEARGLVCGRDLDDEAVAPAILFFRAGAHRAPELGLGLSVDHPRTSGDGPRLDADRDLGIDPEVSDPGRVFAVLGDHVITGLGRILGVAAVGAGGEPDLDLARATGATPGRREVEELRLGVAS